MIEFFKNINKKIKLYPEIWGLPFAIALFFLSTPIIRYFDKTAGVFDIGVLQIIFLLIIMILCINSLSFFGIEFNFSSVFKSYSNFEEDIWKNLTAWQKAIFFLVLYCSLFLSMAILCLAIV